MRIKTNISLFYTKGPFWKGDGQNFKKANVEVVLIIIVEQIWYVTERLLSDYFMHSFYHKVLKRS